MINDPTISRRNVIGSSSAMVAAGPNPGSTPITIPNTAPIRHRMMLVSDRVTDSPSQRSPSPLMMWCSPQEERRRKLDSEKDFENHIARNQQNGRGHDGTEQRSAFG